MSGDLLTAIEAKYSIRLPDSYRSIVDQGWIDFDCDPGQRVQPGKLNYLWLSEAEWLPLDTILNYQPTDYSLPGFVPFAQNGAGDWWMWWPAAGKSDELPVVLCPHDLNEGEFYAPNFTAFLYRNILDYAVTAYADEGEDCRAWFDDWLPRFASIWPAAWSDQIREIASRPPSMGHETMPNGRTYPWTGLLPESENKAIVQRDLAFPDLDREFQWMK